MHAKDTQIYDSNLPRTGVLDTREYTDERNRSWIFRTVGYEHEDSLMSGEEGLTKAAEFLNQILIREQAGAAWWV